MFRFAFLICILAFASVHADPYALREMNSAVLSQLAGERSTSYEWPDTSDMADPGKVERLRDLQRMQVSQVRLASLRPAGRIRPAADCESATRVGIGDRFEYLGQSDHAAWLRISSHRPVELSTFGSIADTTITAFTRCDGEPVAHFDDQLGLAAIAGLPAGEFWVEVSQTTPGIIRGTTTGGFVLGGALLSDDTGQVITNQSAFASIFDEAGAVVVQDDTGFAGRYEFVVPSASYHVMITGLPSYRNEIYDDVPCPAPNWFACTSYLSFATLVEVADQDIPNLDISLASGPGIAGTVRNREGDPLASAYVEISSVTGFSGFNVRTDSQGRFWFRGLDSDDPYRLFALALGHVSQMYEGLDCQSVDCLDRYNEGTVILPRDNPSTSDHVLDLLRPAHLTVAVDDVSSSQSAAGARIRIYNTLGAIVLTSFASSDSTLRTPLLPGSYYVVAGDTSSDYERTVYPDIPCPTGLCESEATVVTMTEADQAITVQIRRNPVALGTVFTQSENPELSGHVCWTEQTRPSTESFVFSKCQRLEDDGTYSLPLPSGIDVWLYFASSQFSPVVFNQVLCLSLQTCDLTLATRITPQAGSDIDADFNVQTKAHLEINVSDALSNEPIDAQAYVYRDDSTFAERIIDIESGVGIAYGLPMGRYWLSVRSPDYQHTAYGGVVCEESFSCENGLEDGDRFDFDLQTDVALSVSTLPFAKVVTSEVTGFDGQAVLNMDICVRDTGSGEISCDAGGSAFLTPGSAQVALVAEGYATRVVGAGDCAFDDIELCSFSSASTYTVTWGDQIHLQESLNAIASLTVETTGFRADAAAIAAIDESGWWVYPDTPDGKTFLGRGQYRLVAFGPQSYATDTYGTYCFFSSSCLGEAPVTIVNVDDHMVRMASLLPKVGVFGRVSDAQGAPASGILVDIWDEGSVIATVQSRPDGYYFAADLPPGDFQISAQDPQGRFLDQVYPATVCPPGTSVFAGTCDLVGSGVNSRPNKVFDNQADMQLSSLVDADRLFVSSFE